jgi:hypothetical protein
MTISEPTKVVYPKEWWADRKIWIAFSNVDKGVTIEAWRRLAHPLENQICVLRPRLWVNTKKGTKFWRILLIVNMNLAKEQKRVKFLLGEYLKYDQTRRG